VYIVEFGRGCFCAVCVKKEKGGHASMNRSPAEADAKTDAPDASAPAAKPTDDLRTDVTARQEGR
jgi:hypothetical protein